MKRFMGIVAVVWATVSLFMPASGMALEVADGFDPEANGIVRAIEIQGDGRLLLGGQFTTAGGIARNRLARVDNDGNIDTGFSPAVTGGGATGAVWALYEQPGGKVLVGGHFDSVAGQSRSNLARVNANGSLDAAFDPQVDGRVLAFHASLSPDGLNGLIYIAGDFATVEGAARSRVARLNANGSLSPTFDPPVFNGYVNVLTPEVGSLIVAGAFGSIDGAPVDAPIARLSQLDGSRDPGFAPSISGGQFGPWVNAAVVQPDGRILIGGNFTTVNGQTRTMVARLHADGTLDSTFVPPTFDATISSIHLQTDGRIVVAGDFDNHLFRQRVARLHADGTLDTSFSTLVAGEVTTLAAQHDGKFVIGGQITNVGAYVRNRIARLNANGTPDVDFEADAPDVPAVWAYSLAVQPDGKVLVGGSDETRAVTRLMSNGTGDSGFVQSLNGSGFEQAFAIALQSDGKIVVGGQFASDRHIVRLNANGSQDSGFDAELDNGALALAIQPDGRIVVGGLFGTVNGQSRTFIARLLPSGAIDAGFAVTTNAMVRTIALQPDGKIVIGGNFTVVNSQPRGRIARLNADGSLDFSFVPPVFDESIWSLAVQPDGKILVGGLFNTVDGQTRRGIERLMPGGARDAGFSPPAFVADTQVRAIALTAGGRIAIASNFYSLSNPAIFVRLLASNGTTIGQVELVGDAQDNVSADALAVQPDGKILVAGRFIEAGGLDRHYIARLAPANFALQSIRVESGELRWYRDGAAPELVGRPQVGLALACCDDEDFAPIQDGLMSRSPGNPKVWTFGGLDIPGSGTVWLKARAGTSDGATGQSALDSSIIAIELEGEDDTIFADDFEIPPR